MVNSTEFGERLQKILDFYGISATELSNQISVNRSTISHLLSGRNKPSLDFIMKILQKYSEVELYWLLNGKGTFPSEIENSSSDLKSDQAGIKKSTSLKSGEKPQIDSSKYSESLQHGAIDRIIIFFKDGSFKSYKN